MFLPNDTLRCYKTNNYLIIADFFHLNKSSFQHDFFMSFLIFLTYQLEYAFTIDSEDLYQPFQIIFKWNLSQSS